MMKSILVIIYSCLSVSSIFGQNYKPFVVENNRWGFTNVAQDFPGAPMRIDRYELVIGQDTLLDGTTYKKVHGKEGNRALSFWGGIREDSAHRVFFRLESQNVYLSSCFDSIRSEILLYDFGAQEKDTIWSCNGANTSVVLEIDTIIVQGLPLTRMKLENQRFLGGIEYWIESMGSVHGVFGPLVGEFENFWKLYCFQNDSLIYGFDFDVRPIAPFIATECKSTVNISGLKLQDLYVYPNPTADNLIIEGANLRFQKLVIENTLGQRMYTDDTHQEKRVLDLSSLKSGIYFLHVIEQGKTVGTRKLIKL